MDEYHLARVYGERERNFVGQRASGRGFRQCPDPEIVFAYTQQAVDSGAIAS